MKYFKALISLILFISILIFFYSFHIKFFRIDVILYSAIFDSFLAVVITAIIIFFLRPFSVFNKFEKLQLAIIWILSGYIFAISIPTVLDRSLSFYILEKLHQRGGGVKLERFESIFTEEYLREHRLMDVRLTEQQASGTLTIEDSCVKLTERGKKLAIFSRFFRKNFLPRKRLLMGTYTDDLVDPFRHSQDIQDYRC